MAAQQVAAPRRCIIPPVSSLVAVAFTVLVITWSIRFSNPGGIGIAAVYALPGRSRSLRGRSPAAAGGRSRCC
jgi:hypothetical protein